MQPRLALNFSAASASQVLGLHVFCTMPGSNFIISVCTQYQKLLLGVVAYQPPSFWEAEAGRL
jgi:hypothetical protein